jgi:hypothetical protein
MENMTRWLPGPGIEVLEGGEPFRPTVARLLWNRHDLSGYLANNTDSLIDHGERYRSKLTLLYKERHKTP